MTGISVAPAGGFRSKVPQGVTRVFVEVLVASAGRRLKMPSPLYWPPVVMLNGEPEAIVTNGDALMAYGSWIEPPTKPRWRVSNCARPQSRRVLY